MKKVNLCDRMELQYITKPYKLHVITWFCEAIYCTNRPLMAHTYRYNKGHYSPHNAFIPRPKSIPSGVVDPFPPVTRSSRVRVPLLA